MRFNQAQTHRLHHHRKGERIRTNVSFEQSSKVHFTAVINTPGNISLYTMYEITNYTK